MKMAKVATSKKFNKGYLFTMFPKYLLRPYGMATEEISGAKMKHKLKTFTCELLFRPGMGISEFAETVQQNTERLE